MTTRVSGKVPEQPRPAMTPQMGSQIDTPQAQAQQSDEVRPQAPDRSPRKPVQFTDWASI